MCKRITSLIIPIALLFFAFVSCSSSEKMKIEDFEWKLATALSIVDGQVVVVAASENNDIDDSASIVEITLTAKDGIIKLEDKTNDRTYTGTYKRTRKTPDGSEYEITIEEKDGYATVAMTKYHDGSETATLPISIGGYTLQFYETK